MLPGLDSQTHRLADLSPRRPNMPTEQSQQDLRRSELPDLPQALLSRSPLRWITIFGPGAIVASVTIGTGELIFSTRGGVLFGYNILFLFVFISLLKWVLVFGTSKHLLLTGVHPFRRMMDLPGPRGWLPMMLLMMICVTQPIWMSFHSSTLGNFVALLTGTADSLNGGAQFMWAILLVSLVVAISYSGGYNIMERIQIVVVAGLMVAAVVSLVMYDPDYFGLLKGVVTPVFGDYPDWIENKFEKVWKTPKWVELTTYVGVIGGAGFDYMAYTTWLREKRWGYAGSHPPSQQELQAIADDPHHPARVWLKAPLIDCGISFLLVVLFSAVFVTSGVELLGPRQEIPDGSNMLGQQSRILTEVRPWLYPLYVAGAILTMFGTLYGTIEIGVAIVTEILRSFNAEWTNANRHRIERVVLAWQVCFAIVVVLAMFTVVYSAETDGGPNPAKEIILQVLRPVNLFTGVLATGIFCLANLWIEKTRTPRNLQSPAWTQTMYVFAGVVFLGLGLKGYWDNHDPAGGLLQSRWFAIGGIIAVTILSTIVVNSFGRWFGGKRA